MIKIKCESSNFLALNEITDFQGDLKERSAGDMEKIKKSIKKHGVAFPIFIWQTEENGETINYCLDGHCRTRALREMAAAGEQIPPLPVDYIHAETEAEAKELLLKLNSQYGHMTADSVAAFLGDIKIDFDELALPDGVLDLGKLEPEETKDDDEAPAVDEDGEPDSQPGEMYELGNSILLCGDSTNPEDVARLMGGIQADMVVTDPPYNVNLGQGGSIMSMEKRHRITDGAFIANDHMEDSAFYEFLFKVYLNIKNFTKEGGAFYVWHADNEGLNFRRALKDAGLTLRQTLIWNKNSLCLGRQDYQWKHESCLYGWIDGQSHAWYNDRKQTTVIDCKRPSKSPEHPTMKPVELFEYQINNSSKAGDIVLDLFGGSGTTIIAAEKLHRKARVMELDPRYCDVIRKRYTKWAKENGYPLTTGCLE